MQSPTEPIHQENAHNRTSTEDIQTEATPRIRSARRSIVQSPIELFNKLPETKKNYRIKERIIEKNKKTIHLTFSKFKIRFCLNIKP